VNSDIIFEPSPIWKEKLPGLVRNTFITGSRYNTTSLLRGEFEYFKVGLDYFFFDKDLIGYGIPHALPFAIGMAFWDYWLPCAALLSGRSVTLISRPATAHLNHPSPQETGVFRKLAQVFANFVVDQAVQPVLPDTITAILPACRDLTMLESDTTTEKWNATLRKFSRTLIPCLHASTLQFDVIRSKRRASHALTPANVFHRFDERLAASQQNHRNPKVKPRAATGNAIFAAFRRWLKSKFA
jgi:hypothetical protein